MSLLALLLSALSSGSLLPPCPPTFSLSLLLPSFLPVNPCYFPISLSTSALQLTYRPPFPHYIFPPILLFSHYHLSLPPTLLFPPPSVCPPSSFLSLPPFPLLPVLFPFGPLLFSLIVTSKACLCPRPSEWQKSGARRDRIAH